MMRILSTLLAITTMLFGIGFPFGVGPQEAAVANADTVQTQSEEVLEGYNIGSPAISTSGGLLFSGSASAVTATSSTILQSVSADVSDQTVTTTEQAFSLPGYDISDPSTIPLGSGSLLYFTKIAIADASGTSTALKNQIGVAYSPDGSPGSWVDEGVVVPQQNGIDNRGGWAPSAVSQDGELWLYYSTNGPGNISVYRSHLDSTGRHILETDRVYYGSGSTMPLSAFNIDVSNDGSQYIMLANTNLSSIVRYVSDDGLHWQTQSSATNPFITAAPGNIIGAPTSHVEDDGSLSLYFAEGTSANARWSSIQEIPDADALQSTTLAAVGVSTNDTTGDTGDSSSSGGGSSSILPVIGLLGVAGIAAYALFGGAATVAAPAAATVAAKVTGFSFGGRVIAILPCVGVLGPSVWVTLLPASPLLPPYMYIWTPETLLNVLPPKPALPPTHIGQELLGRFDIPYVCLTPTVPPIPLYGLRMQIEGESII